MEERGEQGKGQKEEAAHTAIMHVTKDAITV